ncbi:MAG TPA: biopolymer transporter TolR [Saprospiraceae bacterium]|nr:biopolymer transporter TolR [Saprospiraceae bacterium]HNT21362.1 biopolymer transporter TolR [Saprospiraceae bacterium]
MRFKSIFFLGIFFIAIAPAKAQSKGFGVFDTAVDIGKPKISGSSAYDAENQAYHIKGAGYNIWFNRDEFHFLTKRIQGDFIVTADFEFPAAGKEAHRKVGWMVRENLNDDAAHLSATYHGGDGLTVAQWRVMRGAYMRDPQDEIFFPKKRARTIQLERKGKTYTMRIANWGEPLQSAGSQVMENIGDNPYVGIFICSHNADVLEEARVWNVRIDRPMPPNFNFGGADTIGSRLEVLDVFTGKRRVVYESPVRFEAPNFMPDGKSLLINSKGSLWTVLLSGKGSPVKFNTGFADRNNNDHVISFDGKMVGISHHRTGMFGGGSTVYVVPITGGIPKLVTEKTPSYLHGWSANNKEVYYVGRRDTTRNSPYHVYKANIETGAETQLTRLPFGHVDGPEGSPDGQWIYYNSSQTGTMQLWRMKPDGTGNEQLTFDEYNNWFPHISPDGKWIAYISFPVDIDPVSHPACKAVSLKLMPVAGGAPRTIAYLYGGQGTINTPSWSADSKQIAFVSYSGRIK